MTGVAAITAVAWLIDVAFFANVAMAMVVGDWREGLTFRRRRRLIALKRKREVIAF